MPKQLDAREQRFVQEYLIDLAPKRAALAAGYAPSTADQKSFGWVSKSKSTKPHVLAAIFKAQAKRSERTEITQSMVLNELWKMASANMLDYTRVQDDLLVLDLSDISREQAAAINKLVCEPVEIGYGDDKRVVQVVKRFDLADKRQSLVDVGRHLGMFKETVNLSADSSLLEVLGAIDGKTRGLPSKGS